jgi:hypothetical protein
VRYVIVLHRVLNGYFTLVDVFRTVISSGRLEELLAETGARISNARYIAISREGYQGDSSRLAEVGFALDHNHDRYIAEYRQRLEEFLQEETWIEATVYTSKTFDDAMGPKFESVNYWGTHLTLGLKRAGM